MRPRNKIIIIDYLVAILVAIDLVYLIHILTN